MNADRMLVTTDLSEEALRPFGTAVLWARRLGLGITLLHVVEDVLLAPPDAPLTPVLTGPCPTERLAEARELLAREAARLASPVPLTLDVVLATDVPRAIADYADEHGIALIALSTHGRTGLRRVVMGSVAENVIRHAHVPVLVFPSAP